jgi:hypothetical protein
LENFEREREEVELWRRREKILLEASISRLEYIVEFKVESTAKQRVVQYNLFLEDVQQKSSQKSRRTNSRFMKKSWDVFKTCHIAFLT